MDYYKSMWGLVALTCIYKVKQEERLQEGKAGNHWSKIKLLSIFLPWSQSLFLENLEVPYGISSLKCLLVKKASNGLSRHASM